MNFEDLVPGAIIYHLSSEKIKYIVLQSKFDGRALQVLMYSLTYKLLDGFTIRDLDCWKLVSK